MSFSGLIASKSVFLVVVVLTVIDAVPVHGADTNNNPAPIDGAVHGIPHECYVRYDASKCKFSQGVIDSATCKVGTKSHIGFFVMECVSSNGVTQQKPIECLDSYTWHRPVGAVWSDSWYIRTCQRSDSGLLYLGSLTSEAFSKYAKDNPSLVSSEVAQQILDSVKVNQARMAISGVSAALSASKNIKAP